MGNFLVIGNFDGVHLGHQKLIEGAIDQLDDHDRLVLVTFNPHPKEVLSESHTRILAIEDQKKKLNWFLEKRTQGSLVHVIPFTLTFSQKKPESFLEDLELQWHPLSGIAVGYHFRFGHKRSGDAEYIVHWCKSRGYRSYIQQSVQDQLDREISSSGIKESLRVGDLDTVTQWLGHPHFVRGKVQSGQKRGRKLGFPTVNLSLPTVAMPKFGVYVVRITFENGTALWGLAHFGPLPSFDQSEVRFEIHILDWENDLYGVSLRVEWLYRLRDIQKFESEESLILQIQKDERLGREWVKRFGLIPTIPF